jgi:hypothetical protein
MDKEKVGEGFTFKIPSSNFIGANNYDWLIIRTM